MKALILAAGYGSRLAPLTDSLPKSLVPVNGTPILFKQLEDLYENGITDITVISGYRANMLEAAVHDRFRDVKIIESVDYRTTNNMYSAWLAKDAMAGDDFLMMNADVFFDASVIEALLAFDAPNAIVTDIGFYLEESMKVIEDADGRLTRISKQIPRSEALGASIDVYRFSAEAGDAFFRKCEEYILERKEVKLWSEVALNDILAEVTFRACPLKGRWYEIDNHEDLAAAERIFADE
ncbi:MAG: phosphocholine cytidylyltransferase family protein [Clostridia bacterium]|nr:phosphocholine cytidylyltransferase family protein [Clostridia bacterium]